MIVYIHIHLSILHVKITNSKYDQLPVGLIGHLANRALHHAASQRSRVRIPFNFFQAFFSQLLIIARIFLLFNNQHNRHEPFMSQMKQITKQNKWPHLGTQSNMTSIVVVEPVAFLLAASSMNK